MTWLEAFLAALRIVSGIVAAIVILFAIIVTTRLAESKVHPSAGVATFLVWVILFMTVALKVFK